MGGEVVEDHDVAGHQAWRELGLDIGLEDRPVHGSVDHPGGDQLVAAEPRDEGLGAPMAEGRIGQEPIAARRATPQPGHLGRGGRLIKKHQPVRLLAHPGLAQMEPDVALAAHPRASALRRDQGFFYMRSRGL